MPKPPRLKTAQRGGAGYLCTINSIPYSGRLCLHLVHLFFAFLRARRQKPETGPGGRQSNCRRHGASTGQPPIRRRREKPEPARGENHLADPKGSGSPRPARPGRLAGNSGMAQQSGWGSAVISGKLRKTASASVWITRNIRSTTTCDSSSNTGKNSRTNCVSGQ